MNTTKEQRKEFVNTVLLQLVNNDITTLLNMSAKVKLCSEDENGDTFVDFSFEGSHVCNRARLTPRNKIIQYRNFDIEFYNYDENDGTFEMVAEIQNVSYLYIGDYFQINTGLSF